MITISKALVSAGNILEDKERALLIIAFAHYNGVINDASRSAMIKNLREGLLIRDAKNWKCPLDKQQYSNCNTFSVLKKTFRKLTLEKETMPLKEFLDYVYSVLEGNGKPKNFAIDHVYFKYMKPIIKKFGKVAMGIENLLQSFNIPYNEIKFETAPINEAWEPNINKLKHHFYDSLNEYRDITYLSNPTHADVIARI